MFKPNESKYLSPGHGERLQACFDDAQNYFSNVVEKNSYFKHRVDICFMVCSPNDIFSKSQFASFFTQCNFFSRMNVISCFIIWVNCELRE